MMLLKEYAPCGRPVHFCGPKVHLMEIAYLVVASQNRNTFQTSQCCILYSVVPHLICIFLCSQYLFIMMTIYSAVTSKAYHLLSAAICQFPRDGCISGSIESSREMKYKISVFFFFVNLFKNHFTPLRFPY